MLTEKGKRSFQELAEDLPGLALTHYENIKADNSCPFLTYKNVGLSFRLL